MNVLALLFSLLISSATFADGGMGPGPGVGVTVTPSQPSLVQSSTPNVNDGSTNTPSVTLTGVASGDDIFVFLNYVQIGAAHGASATCSDGSSYTEAASIVYNVNTRYLNAVFRLAAASAGTHTITCTLNEGGTGDAPFSYLIASEVAGDNPSTGVDGLATASASSATPATGSTGTLAIANEIVFAIMGGAADGSRTTAGWINPPTGFTSIYSNIGGGGSAFLGASFSYEVVSSTAPVSASWGTLDNSQSWGALIATFQGL